MGNQNRVIEIQNQSGDQKHSSAKVKGLTISFASDLPLVFTPQSEIVQGLLSAGAASLIYGPKNSGKTFIALDLAAAVSRGLPWQGRKTIQGLVVYIAAESRYLADVRLHAL